MAELRLAATGQRDAIHGCGQFQTRSYRGCPWKAPARCPGAGARPKGTVKPVLLSVVEAEVVEEDMLREARKGARGEKPRGGYMGPAVKGGWLATSVVTRGVVVGIRYSYTGACRWGMKGNVERYILGIRAGTISSSIAFERTIYQAGK